MPSIVAGCVLFLFAFLMGREADRLASTPPRHRPRWRPLSFPEQLTHALTGGGLRVIEHGLYGTSLLLVLRGLM